MPIQTQFPISFYRSVALPAQITDDFEADSGEWLDGNLDPAAIAVADGKGVWTPEYGPELHLGPNAISDPASNEANNSSGWTAAGSTVEVVDDVVSVGDYALKVTGLGSGGRAYQDFAVGEGVWVLHTGDVQSDSVGTSLRPINAFPAIQAGAYSNWTSYEIGAITTAEIFRAQVYAAALDRVIHGDNISVRVIQPASLVRLRRIYYPSSVQAQLRASYPHDPIGLILYHDANNYILAALGYTTVLRALLIKRVAGMTTGMVSTSALSYAPGAVLKLTPNANYDTFSVSYNDTSFFSEVSIADFSATPGPWYAGLFLTHNPGDMTLRSFSAFVAERVVDAPSFQSGDHVLETVGEIV